MHLLAGFRSRRDLLVLLLPCSRSHRSLRRVAPECGAVVSARRPRARVRRVRPRRNLRSGGAARESEQGERKQDCSERQRHACCRHRANGSEPRQILRGHRILECQTASKARATIQPQRRRSDRQEDDWGAIKEVGGFAGNSGVGGHNDRRVSHRSRRQLKQAGGKRADAHHAAAGGCGRLAAGMSHSSMVVDRIGGLGTGNFGCR